VNHTRFPKEDHLPDWARRDNKVTKGDRVEYLTVCLVSMTLSGPYRSEVDSAKCCYKGLSCPVVAAIIYFGTKGYAFLPFYDLIFRANCNWQCWQIYEHSSYCGKTV